MKNITFILIFWPFVYLLEPLGNDIWFFKTVLVDNSGTSLTLVTLDLIPQSDNLQALYTLAHENLKDMSLMSTGRNCCMMFLQCQNWSIFWALTTRIKVGGRQKPSFIDSCVTQNAYYMLIIQEIWLIYEEIDIRLKLGLHFWQGKDRYHVLLTIWTFLIRISLTYSFNRKVLTSSDIKTKMKHNKNYVLIQGKAA